VISDSFRLHTGFANVGRHIADHFYNEAKDMETGKSKYEVSYFGWYDNVNAPEKRPYKLYTTMRDNGRPVVADKWGQLSLGRVIDEEKPDIVLAIGDSWMVEHVGKVRNRKRFKYVFYMPVDGEPIPEFMIGNDNVRVDWKANVLNADKVVAFCPFGIRNINMMAEQKVCDTFIPHGVDADVFKPALDSDEKYQARRKHFPMINEDAFLIGFFSRNQPRKAIDKLVHAVSLFIEKYEDPDRPIYLYMHCAFNDKVGWNIPALAKHFKLPPNRMLRDNALNIGAGVPDPILRERYISCDIMALPTRGEGWGLTILESMACGVPVLTSKYSAHADYCEPGSLFIKTANMVCEPTTNIQRCIVSVSDFVEKLRKLYRNENKIIEKLSTGGRKAALNYNWEDICMQWEKLIDSVSLEGLDKSVLQRDVPVNSRTEIEGEIL